MKQADVYETVIGLEVHAELNTKSKAFCGCKNVFGGEANKYCCPICTAMPGALPVLNESAVDKAVLLGLALDCKINRATKLDRKNYFYPDLPKAYQISQHDIPICEKGCLEAVIDDEGTTKTFGITRIHIEEDTGKLIHDESLTESLIDLNRCGVPLVEIVTEPDMRSSSEAKSFLESIRAILLHLDISDCKMQEGSIRCDVNVSVRPKGSKHLGVRVEMKNINSFSGIVRAIEYESDRQINLIKAKKAVEGETRRWDDLKSQSFVLRSKGDENDYRLFKDPDMPAFLVASEKIEKLNKKIGELPNHRLIRYIREIGLSRFDAGLLVENADRASIFESAVELGANPNVAANWLNGEVARILGERSSNLKDTYLSGSKLYELVTSVDDDTISFTSGKQVLEEIMYSDKSVEEVIKMKGLSQISDKDELNRVVEFVLANNLKAVEQYKAGKTNVLGYLVGQCLRETKGVGNPTILKDIILSFLDNFM